jgi:hypothetical protein
MRPILLLLACIALVVAGEPVFRSTFGAGTSITDNVAISGVDGTVLPPNRWDDPVLPWGLEYAPDADPTQRSMAIVPDPGDPSNPVLRLEHFATTSGLSKSSLAIYNPAGRWRDALTVRFRIRLDPGLAVLESGTDNLDGFGRFLILGEFWHKAFPWPEDRVSLRLVRREGRLCWFLDHSHSFASDAPGAPAGGYRRDWGLEGAPVQYGLWYDIELELRQGDAEDGLAVLRWRPAGGAWSEVSQPGRTRHPGHPWGTINGLVPCKLYLDAISLAAITANGVPARVWYDDLEVSSGATQRAVPDVRTIIEGEELLANASSSAAPAYLTVPPAYPLFVSGGRWLQLIGDGGEDELTIDLSSRLGPGRWRLQPAFYVTTNSPLVTASWNNVIRGTWDLFYGQALVERQDLGAVTVPAAGSALLRFAGIKVNQRLRLDRIFATPLPPGDVDGDGLVDAIDLNLVLAAYGRTATDAGWDPATDLDGDGAITAKDVAAAR